ncbi:hypothetical protein DV515_00006096 [Chloebia gouldiae]|uniref:Placenta-specific protein 9 n=1 Tax=Chloebia gouldiae TaxID=44316 RepID=A0A3L8SLA2_CHLGU|nr:hypothetical protein DV515_00006096 [Chloebia gouldiae]
MGQRSFCGTSPLKYIPDGVQSPDCLEMSQAVDVQVVVVPCATTRRAGRGVDRKPGRREGGCGALQHSHGRARQAGTMLFLWALAFVLVLQEQDPLAAGDPVSMLPGSLERGSWCDEHMLHERLDIIEEVIKTVEHLESEVKSLLNIISETTMNIPTVPGTPLIDVFDDLRSCDSSASRVTN